MIWKWLLYDTVTDTVSVCDDDDDDDDDDVSCVSYNITVLVLPVVWRGTGTRCISLQGNMNTV